MDCNFYLSLSLDKKGLFYTLLGGYIIGGFCPGGSVLHCW